MLLLSITLEWVHNLRKEVKEAHLYKPSVKERSVWYSEVKVNSVIPRWNFGENANAYKFWQMICKIILILIDSSVLFLM